jgi:hypothetical protein
LSPINKVILVGNLGKDPEIRSTQDGREIANLSLATAESWKDKSSGERKEKTEWHRVVIFNEGLVKVAKSYLKKGAKVYLEGQTSLGPRSTARRSSWPHLGALWSCSTARAQRATTASRHTGQQPLRLP